MKTPAEICEIPGQDDLEILERYGGLRDALASGKAEPATDRQRYFVEAVRSGTVEGVGRPEVVRHRYVAVMKLIDDFERARDEATRFRATLAHLGVLHDVTDREWDILLKIACLQTTSTFAADIEEKLESRDRMILEHYGYLRDLASEGRIAREQYDKFVEASKLWLALYNAEKIQRGPLSLADNLPYKPPSTLLRGERPAACDRPGSLVSVGSERAFVALAKGIGEFGSVLSVCCDGADRPTLKARAHMVPRAVLGSRLGMLRGRALHG